MVIYMAGLSHVSSCFSVGPLVQGLTLAEGSENLLCGFRDIELFYPSNTRRKNVCKTSGPIRTNRNGKLQVIKLVLETIWTTKHESCGEETTDFICLPTATQTITANARNQILRVTSYIQMKTTKIKVTLTLVSS